MFICFEGIDGSGKTTLSNRLAARLRERGLRLCHAREGGTLGSKVAERVRALTRDTAHLELCERAELLLLAAREAQSLEEVVRPALRRGEWVIADRYLYSHLALARHGRGLEDGALDKVLEFASAGLQPDLVVLVDVEPAVARARKRCQKLRDGRWMDVGRKSQGGAGLNVLVRQGLLELAAALPQRFVVFENTWASVEEAEESLLELVLRRALSPGEAHPSPERWTPSAASPPWRPAGVPVEEAAVRRDFFGAVDAVASREPSLAAWLLSGLTGSEADRRRLRLLRLCPAVVAWGLRSLPGDGALALRHALKALEPRLVAAGLAELGDGESHRLRRELSERAPEEVGQSLAGQGDAEAMALRQALRERAPSGVLAGLARVDTPQAWELREQLAASAGPGALAASLAGLDGSRAWQLREHLWPQAMLEVVSSLAGIPGEQAHEWRLRALARAPRAVLNGLRGLGDARSFALRELLAERLRESLESLEGLDAEEAWSLRERMVARWPAAAVHSLAGLAGGERGQRLLFRLLADFPGNLELLRAAAFVLDEARRPLGAGKVELHPAGRSLEPPRLQP